MAAANNTIAIYSRKSLYRQGGEVSEIKIRPLLRIYPPYYGDAAAEHAVVFEDRGFFPAATARISKR